MDSCIKTRCKQRNDLRKIDMKQRLTTNNKNV